MSTCLDHNDIHVEGPGQKSLKGLPPRLFSGRYSTARIGGFFSISVFFQLVRICKVPILIFQGMLKLMTYHRGTEYQLSINHLTYDTYDTFRM